MTIPFPHPRTARLSITNWSWLASLAKAGRDIPEDDRALDYVAGFNHHERLERPLICNGWKWPLDWTSKGKDFATSLHRS